MDWLTELVPAPETRLPLTLETFIQLFVPPVLCYYATAVLVIVPRTFFVRVALLPVTLWSAFRACTRLDMVARFNDERLIYWNQGLLLMMTTLSLRSIVWSFQLEPYFKTRPTDSQVDKPRRLTRRQVALDALDLSFNLRGLGWNWSQGLYVPPETRPTTSRRAFVLTTLRSALLTILCFDFLHYAVQWFSPDTFGSMKGGSIYDMSRPPLQRYLRSTFISFLSGMVIVLGIQIAYSLVTLLGVLVFRQDPKLWPPAFAEPWFATSLTSFWAKHWHQVFRDIFVGLGSKPLSILFGRLGVVMGAFLVSGILHVLGLWGMGRGTEFRTVGGYFLIMGVGVILERAWKLLTGCRVQGWLGHIWTLLWVVGWGNLLVEAWFIRGLAGSIFFPDGKRPTDFILNMLRTWFHL